MKTVSKLMWPFIFVMWIVFFYVDYHSANIRGKTVFCRLQEETGKYEGAGYSYTFYQNPGSGRNEYIMEMFGSEVKCTLTN